MDVTAGAGATVAKAEGAAEAAEAEEAEEAAVAGRRHAAATLGRAPAAGPTARVTWPRATRRATSRRRGSAASPSLRNLGGHFGAPHVNDARARPAPARRGRRPSFPSPYRHR